MSTPSAPSTKSGFASLFVARPLFGIVINLLILIAGLAALASVDVREMPDVDQPVLSIRTSYEGAVPATVDEQVTQVLEDALSALEGLSYIESSSTTGSSRITIDLSEGTDVDIAANEAREIVSATLRQLPDDIDDPTVTKSDSNADAIIRLALLGDATFNEMTELAEGMIYDRLSLIDGIAEVTVRGNRANEFRVSLDMPSLLSRGLTVFDVSEALTALRDDTPLGTLEANSQTLALRVGNADVTVESVGQVLVNATTRVSDVAFVQVVPEDSDVFARVNGKAAVGMDISRQSVGNTLEISKAVRVAVAELRAELPENVELIVTSDDGIFIEGSINEVIKSIGLATLIVVSVIFAFLRSFRATLIPAVTIPVALIGTIAAIWITGFSVNTISLLALVLATGMVVDDAIVVIENIVRKRKQGMGAFAAAAAGTNEVFFAVISTTATLAAVFIPISFLPGQAGGVFSEFGFVLAFAVTLSSITALTLAPVLAAFLDPGKPDPKATNVVVKQGALSRGFDFVMDHAIRAPMIVLATAVGFALIAGGAASTLTSSITPSEDRGFFLVQARGASDTTVEYLATQVTLVEEILTPYRLRGDISAVQSIIGVGGGTSAFIIVRLPDWSDRDLTQQEIVAQVSRQLSDVPGVQVSARSTNSLNIRGAGRGLQFAVTGTDVEAMTSAADDLIAAMSSDATFLNPQLSDDSVQAQYELRVDPDMARVFGLTEAEIAATVSAMVQGKVAVSVFQDDVETDVNVVPGGPPINDPSDLESIYVRLPDGAYIPVSAAATMVPVVSQSKIERQGGSLAVSVQSNLGEGIDLGTSMERLTEIAAQTLPSGMGIAFTGEAATLTDGQAGMYMVFGVAFVVVFLVLAAQFESVASAVVIMLTVPFGFAAALLAITLSGGSLNYYSQIGLVMLIGVMAKNGILIVEFANQLREAGQDIDSAIRDALRLRIRPVMMTMVSTVFGGLPLILTSGAGAEARIAVGWVIVGGLGFATVFTLFLTPVFYRWIAVWGAEPGMASKRLAKENAEMT
ncbi:hydrophobe/amphiphile efflux-1 (HAE1) family protein [Sulfitobacter undariae]|uniref:Hydrophobe/amphiphile efflux-1 (HAE1) family protein n=1 Tax=Sulfitobacter undariae TaxID=1563671 RepID=A0A7W6E698_9RHOB|nr:efflux RND transporter permease subunit [Sulfitobacter undariae]MBB3993417.1 hydrophobe/amphiphile efflux-1 (HAE1) family protein [Sulfitobacter undariae]